MVRIQNTFKITYHTKLQNSQEFIYDRICYVWANDEAHAKEVFSTLEGHYVFGGNSFIDSVEIFPDEVLDKVYG